MSIDLDGWVRLALAKVAVQIEMTAGPVDPFNPLSVQEHQKHVDALVADTVHIKLSLQDYCEHHFPGMTFHSNMLTHSVVSAA